MTWSNALAGLREEISVFTPTSPQRDRSHWWIKVERQPLYRSKCPTFTMSKQCSTFTGTLLTSFSYGNVLPSGTADLFSFLMVYTCRQIPALSSSRVRKSKQKHHPGASRPPTVGSNPGSSPKAMLKGNKIFSRHNNRSARPL